MKEDERFKTFDGISTRIAGWVGMGICLTEMVAPSLLIIDLQQALGFGVGGLLLGTGRGQVLVEFIRRGLRDE